MTTQPIARLERKQLKEACGMWALFSCLLLMISIVVAGTLPPTPDVISPETFKYGKIALYMAFMFCYFFTVYKTTVSFLKFKAIKIQ